jgi:hypothetical protein
MGRSRFSAGRSGGPAADSFRPEPGVGAAKRGRNEWAGKAKRVARGALICSFFEGGRGKDSPPVLPEGRMQMSAIEAQAVWGNLIHSDKDCLCDGRESRSVGLVPCFHSISVETPSPSWSWWAKPGIRVSIPCSRAQVSGIPSGETWHSWSDSLCSIPMMKSLALCAWEAAETNSRGSFSSF